MRRWTSYADYDAIPLELICTMNIIYLCGEAIGMDMGAGFKEWILKAMESEQQHLNMTGDVWTAVQAYAGDPGGCLVNMPADKLPVPIRAA